MDRPYEAGYAALCVPCVNARWDNLGLNELDWFDIVKRCESCVGTCREPIPRAEIISKRDLNK